MPPPWTRALVTGASSGIGRAMAQRLAAAGTEVVLVARSGDRLTELAAELAAPTEVLVADLADPTQVADVAARIGDDARPVGEWQEMVQVNVTAVVELTHAAIDRYRADARTGAVLNVASVAGFVGSAGLGVYSATKSFLITFGLAVHDEVRPHGVTVTTLCPGLTRTGFHHRAGIDDQGLPEAVWQSADEVAAAGLDGVADGRALVVPGAVNKAVVAGSRLVPLWAQRRLAGAVRSRR